MALSNEDKKDVKVAFGKKVAGAVDKATHDRWAADSKRAKSQFDSLHASGKMGLPSTAPSKWDSDHSTGAPRAEGKKKDMAKKMSRKSKDPSEYRNIPGVRMDIGRRPKGQANANPEYEKAYKEEKKWKNH